MTPVAPRGQSSELFEYLVSTLLGCLLLTILFAWVMVDAPFIPQPVRILVAVMAWLGAAAALAYLRPEGSWRWGVRLALPAVVVLGYLALNNAGGLGWLCAGFLAGALAAGCAGGWLGGQLACAPAKFFTRFTYSSPPMS